MQHAHLHALFSGGIAAFAVALAAYRYAPSAIIIVPDPLVVGENPITLRTPRRVSREACHGVTSAPSQSKYFRGADDQELCSKLVKAQVHSSRHIEDLVSELEHSVRSERS